jgi:hypothetical protein
MFIPRLKGAEKDLITVYDIKYSKQRYNSYPYGVKYTTAKGKIVLTLSNSGWVQDVGFVYYKIDGVFYTTRTYHNRYIGFFTARASVPDIVFVTTQDFKAYIEENTICINNLKYKSLREKRIDLQNFKNYLCNLPNSKLTVTAKL